MRILICQRPAKAFGYISDGWIHALRHAGNDVRRWDGQEASWNAFDPDLYLGSSAHTQPIPRSRRAKLAIHVNPYSEHSIRGIDERGPAIAWTLAQAPDLVFGYGHAGDRGLWSFWTTRHGIPWAPLATAGDTILFSPDTKDKQIDIGYVGGYWPYKARNIDSYLLPLLTDSHCQAQRMICVRSADRWPHGITSSKISDQEVPQFLAGCKLGPCVVEPHTSSWGIDLPERTFKLALSGVLVVHDPVVGLERYLASALVADSPKQYVDLCMHWSSAAAEADRRRLVEIQRNEVLAGHTYFHRMATLFEALHAVDPSVGFDREAEHLLRSARRTT